jgi:hypothetical protein
VQLDAGPTLMVHLHGESASAGAREGGRALDRAGQAVLMDFPKGERTHG